MSRHKICQTLGRRRYGPFTGVGDAVTQVSFSRGFRLAYDGPNPLILSHHQG